MKTTKTVSLIVSKCTNENRIYGDRLIDITFSTLEEAIVMGDKKRAAGLSVIVRPNYNEHDSKGKFYRELRSFNSNNFKECQFRL